MQQNKNARQRGFTLIELLVVVLIIGILAAVALPQYQVAVEKSRAGEALTNINSLKKAIDIYVLEHGMTNVTFVGREDRVDLDIDVVSHLDCGDLSRNRCYSKYFGYYASCSLRNCGISVERNFGADEFYGLNLEWTPNEVLAQRCWYEGELSERVCNSLSSLGWEPLAN